MKTKKILALLAIPAFAFVLSGCGKKADQNIIDDKKQATEADSTTPAQKELPALPANNKKAIDSEVKGIDTELKTTDAALSKDATDSTLGL